MKLSGFAEIFTFSTPAPVVSILADIAHFAMSSLIWRNVWMCMRSFIAKYLSRLKLNIIEKSNFWNEYAICISPHEARKSILHEKNAFFASLDEINGILIPKIWISSIYSSRTKINLCLLVRILCCLLITFVNILDPNQKCWVGWQSNMSDLGWKVKGQPWPSVLIYSNYCLIMLAIYSSPLHTLIWIFPYKYIQ